MNLDIRDYVSIQCLIKQRRSDGSAPVVFESADGNFYALPTGYDAVFELILRHLHKQNVPPWPDRVNPQALLANRALEALKLPGRYIPTANGAEIVCLAAKEAPQDAADSAKTTNCTPDSASHVEDAPMPNALVETEELPSLLSSDAPCTAEATEDKLPITT
jgi:hypothetical protein